MKDYVPGQGEVQVAVAGALAFEILRVRFHGRGWRAPIGCS